MADFVLKSLRGGMNNTDPAIALPEDQAVLQQNTELVDGMLGDRRRGTDAIDLPASITAHDRVPFGFRHLPTGDETASELHVLGVTGTASATLAKKTTSWSSITISDTPTLTGTHQYRWQAITLHGKAFYAYRSNVDRLHVIDDTGAMRRVGLAEPAAPTGANTGAGSLSGTRYYRVRFTVQDGGDTILRSEPSDVLTFAPSGSGTAVRITKPASISEGETHWELEASLDNANFYVIATTAVGTTTYDDSTAFNNGYTANPLSEDVGDYALIPSAKYLAADNDRLLWAGSYEDAALGSRVGWTPVYGADGVGNDERFETDTDPFLDLDTYEGGEATGLSSTVLGANWFFKQRAIYKLVRTGTRTAAYAAIKYSDVFGAIPGSVIAGVDEAGQPCLYFLDYDQGPCRLGYGGIKRCGEDLRKTWEALNIDATAVACSALYYPAKKQAIWNIAVDSDNTPTKALVLHVDKARTFEDGVRKGWTLWTGNRCKALAMWLYADNVDDNTTRSRTLVPFIGLEGLGLVHRCDTGTADNSVAYAATITTKPYTMESLIHQFEVKGGALLAKAVASAQITLKVFADFDATNRITSTVSDISLAATAAETDVIKVLDDLDGAEFRVAQFQFVDVASPAARWELHQLALRGEMGQTG